MDGGRPGIKQVDFGVHHARRIPLRNVRSDIQAGQIRSERRDTEDVRTVRTICFSARRLEHMKSSAPVITRRQKPPTAPPIAAEPEGEYILAVNLPTRRCSDRFHSRVVLLLSFPRSTARVIVATEAEVMVTTLPAELVVVRVLHWSSVTNQKEDCRPKIFVQLTSAKSRAT
jgi:hypothetical protein